LVEKREVEVQTLLVYEVKFSWMPRACRHNQHCVVVYCMSEKSCQTFIVYSLYKFGQVFLDIQYPHTIILGQLYIYITLFQLRFYRMDIFEWNGDATIRNTE